MSTPVTLDSPALEAASQILNTWTIRLAQPEADRLDIYIDPENIVPAVQALVTAGGWHLSAITGLDVPQTQQDDGQIEVLYHFFHGRSAATLRTAVTYGMPTISTICGVIPAAVLYEREVVEMLGVIIDGLPMRDRLLLPDDWPDWVYPLRKSFKGLE